MAETKSKFRTKYDRRIVDQSFEGVVSMTDQQFVGECSVDGIIRKYGILPPPQMPQTFGDVSKFGDFAECMEKVEEGRDRFMSLPSEVRARFGNDPRAFYVWLMTEASAEDARKYGLLKPAEGKSVETLLSEIAENTKKEESHSEGVKTA